MNHFTWMQYLEALAILLVIYYGTVFFKYYFPDYQSKFSASKTVAAAPIANLQYAEPINEESEDPLVAQTEKLIGHIKQVIAVVPQKQQMAAQIRGLFKEFQIIKDTPLRPAINELVVTECEKTDAALLTEAEVNEWWEA